MSFLREGLSRRDLFLLVIAEYQGTAQQIGIANRLRFFEGLAIDGAPACDLVLGWLIKNKIVGKKFIDFYDGDCKGSALEAGKYILAKIKKEEIRPLYVGKDVLKN